MKLIDTSVIIDARDNSSPFHDWAIEQIALAVSSDSAAVNPVVLAEASIRAEGTVSVEQEINAFGVQLLDLPVAAANPAAKAYKVYLERRKKEGTLPPASKVPLPDFLIGAHAVAESCPLITRDPDRVRAYFPQVQLICP